MAKHDAAARSKDDRNAAYALKYKQRKCENKLCGHKSSRKGHCILCGGKMK